MNLTAREMDCLKHRLEVLGDSEVFGEPKPANFDTALARVQLLVHRGNIPDSLTQLEKEILAECVEGSTWASSIEGRMHCKIAERQAIRKATKETEDLGAKLESIVGRRITMPA